MKVMFDFFRRQNKDTSESWRNQETARAIITYPYTVRSGEVRNAVLLVLDKIAIGRGQDAVYALPGGTIEVDELPKAALIREIQEELGLRVIKASKISQLGRHHIFEVSVEGVLDQKGMDLRELMGVGFLNADYRIPDKYLQGHLRSYIREYMLKGSRFEQVWELGSPSFKIRGYFFTGNRNNNFYDWKQQKEILRKGKRFDQTT